MSIKKDGFLSPDIQRAIGSARAANMEPFALTERLRRLSMTWLFEIIPEEDRASVTMLLIFARAVTSFQSIEILAERGLAADARTIARSFLESVTFYGAAKSDPEFIDRLIAADRKHRENIAKPLIKMGAEESGLDAEAIERLNSFLNDPDAVKAGGIAMEGLMRSLGLGDIYDTFFRSLSGDSAHTTVQSLNRHASVDQEGMLNGTKFGPDFSDLNDTLMTACTIMFYLLAWVREKYPTLSNIAEVDSCWNEYKRITGSKV